VVLTCTRCGRRYFPTVQTSDARCRDCLADEFDLALAREIGRAISRMPPRRSDAPQGPAHRPAQDS
jgi:hypothetical protein